jgi:hypothetical protein
MVVVVMVVVMIAAGEGLGAVVETGLLVVCSSAAAVLVAPATIGIRIALFSIHLLVLSSEFVA